MAREAFVNISNYDAGAGLSESMPVQGAGVMENPKDFYFGKTKERKKKKKALTSLLLKLKQEEWDRATSWPKVRVLLSTYLPSAGGTWHRRLWPWG